MQLVLFSCGSQHLCLEGNFWYLMFVLTSAVCEHHLTAAFFKHHLFDSSLTLSTEMATEHSEIV